MQISTEYGFVFLCMPKCASTSIEEAIRATSNTKVPGLPKMKSKHINARGFSTRILPLLPSIEVETFCLVREPLDWINSWYRFRTREVLKDPDHPGHKNYAGNVSYNEFIETYLSEGERPPFANLATQYNFVKSLSGDIGVDYIFPLEGIDKVSEFLSTKTGKQIKIPRKNISPKIDIELDRDLKEKLAQHLSMDIALYNFVKDQGHYSKALHAEMFAKGL